MSTANLGFSPPPFPAPFDRQVIESEREHARKMRKLEGLELRKADGGDADAHADDLSPSSKQGFKEKLITKIIDNLQVCLVLMLQV